MKYELWSYIQAAIIGVLATVVGFKVNNWKFWVFIAPTLLFCRIAYEWGKKEA